MGESPIYIDMSDTLISTDHKRNFQTFAELTSNVVLPKISVGLIVI
jgi:hypothetical protein